MKYSLEISSLSHSIIFLYFFALITEEGFLMSLWYSLELCIQMSIESESEVASRIWLFATPWTAAYQGPLSLGFSRQEYWSGLPFPSPGYLPNPGIELQVSRIAVRRFTIWATREALQMSIPFLFSFSPFPLASLLFQLFVSPCQTIILPFCISFSWGWSWSLPPVQCHEPPYIVHQALYLPDLIPWIYLSLPLFIHKGFDLCHTWMV